MNRSLIAMMMFCSFLLCSYLAFVNYTEPNEAGLTYNRLNGELSKQERSGYHVTPPWVSVSKIDTRPMRVCVASGGRDVSCKLARFEPSAYKEFLQVEGFRYYWWSNRISLNMGYPDEYRGMKDLLRGYAFSVKKYNFLTVLQDYSEPQ